MAYCLKYEFNQYSLRSCWCIAVSCVYIFAFILKQENGADLKEARAKHFRLRDFGFVKSPRGGKRTKALNR